VKNILIVDDSMDDRDVLMSFLTHEGYSCDEASNGKEALEKIKAKKFDLIISDFQMPDGDGPWLATELSKLKLSLKLILVSSDAVSEGQSLYKAGLVDFFLSKPLDFKLLLTKIRSLSE
jgi:CheY-like chemotaxis protein